MPKAIDETASLTQTHPDAELLSRNGLNEATIKISIQAF